MKHWVFDLDGTLVDSFSHFFESLKEIYQAHGATFDQSLHQAALTDPLPQMFERHLGPAQVAPAFEKLRELSNRDAQHIRPFVGVEAFLTGLRNQGARIGVWTNRDFESASLILNHSGLSKYVDEFVSGDCTTLRKPHPEGLQRIITQFGANPSEVTMVGDHEHDVTAARDAGTRGVRASWHGYWPVETCTLTPHHFHDFSQFTSWAAKSTVAKRP